MPKPLVAAPINLLSALNFSVPTPQGFPPFDKEQILAPQEPLETLCDALCFLDHLLMCGCGGVKDGCNWVIVINGKYYAMYWRDVAPRGPATRQVWDVYCFQYSSCEGCPTIPTSLGYFWCWEDVIGLLKSEVRRTWRAPNFGAGGYVVAVGTDVFTPSSFLPQVAPRLWLDASDDTTLTLNGTAVEQWDDKSTNVQNATQATPANQPELVPNVQNSLPVLRFDPANESFLNLRLRNQSDFHLFVVGRFNTNALNPRGTFVSAAGFEAPFSGLEGGGFQDASIQPEGTLYTFVDPEGDIIPMLMVPVAVSGEFTIFEWAQRTDLTGDVQIGNNAIIETAFEGDTSGDFWDSTQETFGEPTPLPAAIGRQNQGINPASSYNYLDGDIGEIILYPEVLSTGQRISVLNFLRDKWGLGAPLGLPEQDDC